MIYESKTDMMLNHLEGFSTTLLGLFTAVVQMSLFIEDFIVKFTLEIGEAGVSGLFLILWLVHSLLIHAIYDAIIEDASIKEARE